MARRVWRDGTWQIKDARGINIVAWAPEIHFLKGTFWLTHSIVKFRDGQPPQAHFSLLKSTSDKAERPYVDAAPEPLATGIDASLFQDDDGAVYRVSGDGRIARMRDDMSGLAEEPRLLSRSTRAMPASRAPSSPRSTGAITFRAPTSPRRMGLRSTSTRAGEARISLLVLRRLFRQAPGALRPSLQCAAARGAQDVLP